MKQRLSSRSEQAVETGQVVVKALIKEPVKEAVREALAEERSRRDESTDRGHRSSGDGSTNGGSRLLSPKVLLPLAGLVAVAVYAKRRKGITMDTGGTERTASRRDSGTAGPSDAEEGATVSPSGSASEGVPSYGSEPEQVSDSDGDTESESGTGSDGDDESEDADEEATARS